MKCDKCGSNDVNHEVKKGRGLPPKEMRGKYTNRKTSWIGIWDVYACNMCDNKWSKLRD